MVCIQVFFFPRLIHRVLSVLPSHPLHSQSKPENTGVQIPSLLKETEAQDVCKYKALVQVLSFCKSDS